ncbi:mCG145382, partial [Mus musculus]
LVVEVWNLVKCVLHRALMKQVPQCWVNLGVQKPGSIIYHLLPHCRGNENSHCLTLSAMEECIIPKIVSPSKPFFK